VTLADYARNPDVEYAAKDKTVRALRESVAYRCGDLRRGWRITMPNLEQTGQLLLSYAGIEELAADESKWTGFGEPLAGATGETRRLLMQTLLDEMRRNICIESLYLTEDRYEDIKRPARNGSVHRGRSPTNKVSTRQPATPVHGPGPRRASAGTSTSPGSASTAAGCADGPVPPA